MPAQTSSVTFNAQSRPSGNLIGSQTQTLTRKREKIKDSVKADDIVEHKFFNKKEQEGAVLKTIKEQYSFDELKDAFDERAVPYQLDFFYGREDQNFTQASEFLSQSKEDR